MAKLSTFVINKPRKEPSILSHQKMENNNNNNGIVRKGAWTKEEDALLRDCIHTYGEGKWHLVPLRAGLRRCRKSCRLRWLNYLRPNLKRGFFNEDEVDLIVRLHKLLGNKWSLIAGRLPGRTANDIKNFWNSHISKRPPPPAGENHRLEQKTITASNIVRPRPRTFSPSQPPAWSAALTGSTSSSPPPPPPPAAAAEDNPASSSSIQEDLDECMRWWADLLEMAETGGERSPFPISSDEARRGGGGGGGEEGLLYCGSFSCDFDMDWNMNIS